MNYKIWKSIKIKRIRVPDILCVNNGIRIESRAKTKLEISMSHSTSDPLRGWDYGLKDNDYVAIVVCSKYGDKPIDWQADNLVQFISIRDLRDSVQKGNVVSVKPKGAQEGFEVRLIWPSSFASSQGTISETTSTAIRYKTLGSRANFVRLFKGGKALLPLVAVGDTVFPNQIIASTVLVQKSIPNNPVSSDSFLNNLASLNLSERYAAAKALSYFREDKVLRSLKQKIADPIEHIYVKLEAAASLARFEEDDGYTFIQTCLADGYLQNVLESVIVLAEIKSDRACKLLCDILLNESFNSEIRAGAAWGLGEQQNKTALNAIVSSFTSFDNDIKTEAARALRKLSNNFSGDILQKFDDAAPSEKPGVAWALSTSNTLSLDQLLNSLKDDDSRHWVSYIIGNHGQERYVTEIEKLKNKDAEVYFAVTLLWKIMTSWIYKLKEY